MRRNYLAIAGVAIILTACGGKNTNTEKSTGVDFEKPLYRISQAGDTLAIYKYDQNFNLIEYIAEDYSFNYLYNEKNQLIEETDVEGGYTRYEYDDKGNVKKLTKYEYCEYFEYNDKNLLITDSVAYNKIEENDSEVLADGDGDGRQSDYLVERYRYVDNKQIKEYTESYDYGTETVFDVRYCIDSEFKYDTLELIGCDKNLEWYQSKNQRQWKLINGKQLNTLTNSYYFVDGEESFGSSIQYEYNEQGVETKYVYCTQEGTPQETITYTIEGNKVTSNKGNVTYYLEK